MDYRRAHAAAKAIATRFPNLYLLRSEAAGDGPLSTSELFVIALVALDAADAAVDDGD